MNNYCIIIPTYNCGEIIISVVDKLVKYGYPIVIVNDGSNKKTKEIIDELAIKNLNVIAIHRDKNGGKGAAVKDGIRWAKENGYTHALQIDSDGQHNTDDLPQFIEASQKNSDALILGVPIFSDDAPLSRTIGRKISIFWVMLETLSTAIKDPLFGFRVYPVNPTYDLIENSNIGNYMEFDPEIAVKLYWKGLPVINVESRVIYNDEIPSHFDVIKDNIRISKTHSKLFLGMLARIFPLIIRKFR